MSKIYLVYFWNRVEGRMNMREFDDWTEAEIFVESLRAEDIACTIREENIR